MGNGTNEGLFRALVKNKIYLFTTWKHLILKFLFSSCLNHLRGISDGQHKSVRGEELKRSADALFSKILPCHNGIDQQQITI